jgi:Leucine-rich repeat (LRR) protein
MIQTLAVVAVLFVIFSGVSWYMYEDEVNKPISTDVNNNTLVPRETNITKNVDTEKVVDTVSENNELNLSGQELEKLPSDLLTKSDLVSLNLSNNNFSGPLPSEIRFLQNLKVLNLSNNNFTGVPAEIGQLKNLEILDLSSNKITGLPNELGNLQKLKTLNLKGNDYSETDLVGIKSRLPNAVEILVD